MKFRSLTFRFLPSSAALLISLVGGLVSATQTSAALKADYPVPEPGTYTLPVIRAAADGAVLDTDGQPRSLRELTRGRITVLSFIYTRCASARACPYATGVLHHLHRRSQEDPGLAASLGLISLSFDPQFDTPERLRAYSAWTQERTAASPWHFLTTASDLDLRPILKAYGQAVDRKADPKDPQGPLHHTLRVFLIDRSGRIRNIYSSDTLDPRLVLADIRTLQLEEAELAGTP